MLRRAHQNATRRRGDAEQPRTDPDCVLRVSASPRQFFARLILFGVCSLFALHAETGYDAWLRYAALDGVALAQARQATPAVVTLLDDSPVARSAQSEIVRGLRGMLGRTLRTESAVPAESALVLGTLEELRRAEPAWRLDASLPADGYQLKTITSGRARFTVIAASDSRGVLYGSFALLRKIALGETIANLDERQAPYAPVRWVNHWDNLNGTIERGYGGASIFWENGQAREDLTRVSDYGRLLASLGINGCSINNVNADPQDPHRRLPAADRAHRRGLPALGRARGSGGGFRQPASHRRTGHFRSARARVAAWWKATRRRTLPRRSRISAASS